MLHGKGAENFFKDFRNWYNAEGMERQTGKRWSEFLIYGSDFPYFGPKHAFGLIYYLMNKEFFDSGGTLEDMQNILGLNGETQTHQAQLLSNGMTDGWLQEMNQSEHAFSNTMKMIAWL